MGLGPEDLAKVVLVSSPDVSGGRVLFTVAKVSLEQNRYESSVWVYEGGTAFLYTPKEKVEKIREKMVKN